MPTKIFNFFNLKPGVDVEAYKKFSRENNQPLCRQQPECYMFQDYIVKGEANGKPFYMVIEEIEAESFEVWQKKVYSSLFDELNRQWFEFIDKDSLIEIYCETI